MEIRANRNDLRECLSPLTAAIGHDSKIPAVEFFAFDAEGEAVTVTAYNLSLAITATIPATILTPGKICVKGAKLLQALEKFEKEDVCIDAPEGSVNAKIKCGKSGISIPALPFDDFPKIKEVRGGTQLTVPGKTLKSMMARVQYASAVNDHRTALNGTYLNAGEEGLTAVCCDGFRLAKISKECPEIASKDVGVIIPQATAAELAKLLPTDDKSTVKIRISGTNMIVEAGNLKISSRLLAGDYIDYKRLLNSSLHKISLEIPREKLLAVLGRAAVISEEKVAGSTKPPVVVSVQGSTMTVSATSTVGASREEMEIQHDGADITVGFNNRHLIDTVKACSSEKVKVLIANPTAGVYVLPADDAGAENFFVMPVRLRSA